MESNQRVFIDFFCHSFMIHIICKFESRLMYISSIFYAYKRMEGDPVYMFINAFIKLLLLLLLFTSHKLIISKCKHIYKTWSLRKICIESCVSDYIKVGRNHKRPWYEHMIIISYVGYMFSYFLKITHFRTYNLRIVKANYVHDAYRTRINTKYQICLQLPLVKGLCLS